MVWDYLFIPWGFTLHKYGDTFYGEPAYFNNILGYSFSYSLYQYLFPSAVRHLPSSPLIWTHVGPVFPPLGGGYLGGEYRCGNFGGILGGNVNSSDS